MFDYGSTGTMAHSFFVGVIRIDTVSSILLQQQEVSSFDYNAVRALAEGRLDSFMGFRIIRTEQLPLVEGVRSCLAWVKSRAQFGIWDDFKVKLSVRDDLDETLQIRAKFACGATRLQEEGFVKILCAD